MCRAVANAVRVAMEPPLTKSPPADVGRPQSCRSQSMVTSSISAGPEATAQEPTNGLKPATSASAMALTKLLGLGTKEKKRGCDTERKLLKHPAAPAAKRPRQAFLAPV